MLLGIILAVVLSTSSLGLLTNNPMNLEIGQEWIGRSQKKLDSRFETFESPFWGLRAGALLLQNYQRGLAGPTKLPLRTIRQIISVFAPAAENDTEAYINFVSIETEINPDLKINLIFDLDMLREIMKSIVRFEQGHQPFADDMFDKAIQATRP